MHDPLESQPSLDLTLAYSAFFILAMGLLMVASSSMGVAEISGSPLYYLSKQALYLIISLMSARFCMRFPVRWWFDRQVVFLLASFFLLTLVIIPVLVTR